MAAIFIVVAGVSAVATGMPVHVLIVYLGTCLLADIVYAMDKSAAQRNAWRTKESTLHMLSLLGGCGVPTTINDFIYSRRRAMPLNCLLDSV